MLRFSYFNHFNIWTAGWIFLFCRVTLYSEFLPSKQRAKCLVLTEVFWALGSCFEVLLALFVMPTLGWRWLLGLSSIPLIIFDIACLWMPESARYYMASGQTERAYAVLERIAKENGQPMPPGELVSDAGTSKDTTPRGRFRDLVGPDLRRTTLLLWIIWYDFSVNIVWQFGL